MPISLLLSPSKAFFIPATVFLISSIPFWFLLRFSVSLLTLPASLLCSSMASILSIRAFSIRIIIGLTSPSDDSIIPVTWVWFWCCLFIVCFLPFTVPDFSLTAGHDVAKRNCGEQPFCNVEAGWAGRESSLQFYSTHYSMFEWTWASGPWIPHVVSDTCPLGGTGQLEWAGVGIFPLPTWKARGRWHWAYSFSKAREAQKKPQSLRLWYHSFPWTQGLLRGTGFSAGFQNGYVSPFPPEFHSVRWSAWGGFWAHTHKCVPTAPRDWITLDSST